MKRALDLIVSISAAPIALPLCMLLAMFIRMESPGNPFFVQWRVGREKKPFRMIKLRTMRIDTAHVPSHEVATASITRLGRLLRKLKLDELPQLWNVLSGTMSLVGPRPCLLSQHELIAAREERGLFALLPGVTGPAQVLGLDMSDPLALAEVEARYFSRVTFRGDIRIILSTFVGRGAGDAAIRGSNRYGRSR